MDHLLYIAHSSDEVRLQALYSALSACAWQQGRPLRIHVYTDVPADFARLGARVELHSLSQERIRQWIQPAGYAHRLKPAVLQDLARQFPEDRLLFADADTLFRREPALLFERIAPGCAVMHEREYNVAQRNSPMMYRFRRRLSRARFRGGEIELDRDMWNSGAVGLGPDLFPLLAEWLEFLDEVFPTTRRWVLEQFALSLLLQRTGREIRPAGDVLTHYWYDKPRHLEAIRERLAEAEHADLEALLELVRQRPIDIPRPPATARRANLFQRLFGF